MVKWQKPSKEGKYRIKEDNGKVFTGDLFKTGGEWYVKLKSQGKPFMMLGDRVVCPVTRGKV